MSEIKPQSWAILGSNISRETYDSTNLEERADTVIKYGSNGTMRLFACYLGMVGNSEPIDIRFLGFESSEMRDKLDALSIDGLPMTCRLYEERTPSYSTSENFNSHIADTLARPLDTVVISLFHQPRTRWLAQLQNLEVKQFLAAEEAVFNYFEETSPHICDLLIQRIMSEDQQDVWQREIHRIKEISLNMAAFYWNEYNSFLLGEQPIKELFNTYRQVSTREYELFK